MFGQGPTLYAENSIGYTGSLFPRTETECIQASEENDLQPHPTSFSYNGNDSRWGCMAYDSTYPYF